MCAAILFCPSGAGSFSAQHPRLAPWAAFFRRFAASDVEDTAEACPAQDFLDRVAASGSYFSAGGTYSLGLAEPSPKKNISNCLTMTSWSSRRAGFRRYSLSSILQCSIHMRHASWETLS